MPDNVPPRPRNEWQQARLAQLVEAVVPPSNNAFPEDEDELPLPSENLFDEDYHPPEPEGRKPRWPELELIPIRQKRRVDQPRFKIEYDNLNDIRMRLINSIVYVGGGAYYVTDVTTYKKEYWLILRDDKGKRWSVPYGATAEINLRTPEPRYLQVKTTPMFFIRTPAREQSQGLSGRNVMVKPVGTAKDYQRWHELTDILTGLSSCDPDPWSELYADLMVKKRLFPSIRLSNHVAFYLDHQDKLLAEYKGRYLGEVQDDTIHVDARDYARPWIARDVSEIGCTPVLRKE
jgi:hypothetical protein